MPTSLGFWEWGCPKRGDAHITGTPPPFLSPVSSRLIFMFALFPRGPNYLRAWKGTRLKDPTNTRPDLLPTNTRHFDFLSPDRSPNNPRWRQSRNQSRCMHRCLQSSIITTASRLENLSSSYGGNENASCTWRYWGVVGNNYGRDVTSGSQTPEENGLI